MNAAGVEFIIHCLPHPCSFYFARVTFKVLEAMTSREALFSQAIKSLASLTTGAVLPAWEDEAIQMTKGMMTTMLQTGVGILLATGLAFLIVAPTQMRATLMIIDLATLILLLGVGEALPLMTDQVSLIVDPAIPVTDLILKMRVFPVIGDLVILMIGSPVATQMRTGRHLLEEGVAVTTKKAATQRTVGLGIVGVRAGILVVKVLILKTAGVGKERIPYMETDTGHQPMTAGERIHTTGAHRGPHMAGTPMMTDKYLGEEYQFFHSCDTSAQRFQIQGLF